MRRVSLRPRNPAAAPDAWERKALTAFDTAVAAGENPVPASEQFEGRLRYLVPQRVQGVCLTCHGDSIGEDVAAALDQYYPEDTARGYQLGEVRGAISLTSP